MSAIIRLPRFRQLSANDKHAHATLRWPGMLESVDSPDAHFYIECWVAEIHGNRAPTAVPHEQFTASLGVSTSDQRPRKRR